MKKDTISIGTKFGTEKFAVEVSVNVADTLVDVLKLAKDDETFAVKMFNRGWRIWNQEASGARDYVAATTVAQRKDVAKLTAEVQTIVDEADPTAPAKRVGRPAKPQEVKVDASVSDAMKSGDLNALAALLAAQGVKINFSA